MTSKRKTNAERVAANKEFRRKARNRGSRLDTTGRLVPARPHQDEAMAQFWAGVDRSSMSEALAESGDDKAVALAHYLLNPTYKGSLSRACRECGVTLHQLNDLWRKHNLALGLINVSNRLPKILDDTARDAESRYEVCPRCDGLGTITRPVMKGDVLVEQEAGCPKCKGAKEVRVGGDAKARDQVFEAVGLTGKAAGPLVAIQQNIMGDSLEDTLSVAQKIIQKHGE